ncbi:MAG: ABC transporter permease [Acidimicrobiales bacterium]
MTWGYVLRRTIMTIPAIFGILTISFVLVYLVPGDPSHLLAGENATEQRLAEIEEQFGFQKPVLTQYTTYVSNVVRGDLGSSYTHGEPVRHVIWRQLWPTVVLTGSALLVSTVVGIAAGVLVARRPFGLVDQGVSFGVLLGYSLPTFWLGQLAILLFAIKLGWFPIGGMEDLRNPTTGLAHIQDVAFHLVLPCLTLAAAEVAVLLRVTRGGLLEQLGSDYARTARAKGVPPGKVVSRHALPNALLPVVTVIGARAGLLFSGAVIVETVFSWPGFGTLLVTAARDGDRPLMLGGILLIAVTVVVFNVVTDLAYAKIDPRVSYG